MKRGGEKEKKLNCHGPTRSGSILSISRKTTAAAVDAFFMYVYYRGRRRKKYHSYITFMSPEKSERERERERERWI